MKKLLALLLVFVLALGVFSACGTTEPAASDAPASDAPATDGTTPDDGDVAEPAGSIKVAAIETAYGTQMSAPPSPRPPASRSSSSPTRTLRTSSAPPCRAASIPTSSTWPPAVKPA